MWQLLLFILVRVAKSHWRDFLLTHFGAKSQKGVAPNFLYQNHCIGSIYQKNLGLIDVDATYLVYYAQHAPGPESGK